MGKPLMVTESNAAAIEMLFPAPALPAKRYEARAKSPAKRDLKNCLEVSNS
jgi:hypothetical protein